MITEILIKNAKEQLERLHASYDEWKAVEDWEKSEVAQKYRNLIAHVEKQIESLSDLKAKIAVDDYVAIIGPDTDGDEAYPYGSIVEVIATGSQEVCVGGVWYPNASVAKVTDHNGEWRIEDPADIARYPLGLMCEQETKCGARCFGIRYDHEHHGWMYWSVLCYVMYHSIGDVIAIYPMTVKEYNEKIKSLQNRSE